MRLRGHTRMLAGSILAALTLGLASAAISNPPQTTDPRDRINIWEGHWKIQVQRKETPYSHANSVPFDVVCSWTADRGYMVCEYLSDGIDPQEGKVADHLTIFTYNDTDKAYKHLGISKNFKTLEEPTTIEGNVWTTPFELTGKKGEKLQCRNVYEFVSPEKQVTRFEISSDGGLHWTLVSEGVGTKVH
jgi:hypothetical protein